MNNELSAGTVIDDLMEEVQRFAREQMEYKEKALADIITKYDFLVGSKECKYRLMSVLPEGANIICSPYIEDATAIYAIKKFDIADFIQPYNSEDENEIRKG